MKPISPRLAASLLVVSYVLLVSIVVLGAFWIPRQFAEAKADRCAILVVEVEFLIASEKANSKVPADFTPDVVALLDRIKAQVTNICDVVIR